jgi:hypothetical protein
MKWMLDTDTCIAIIKGKPASVLRGPFAPCLPAVFRRFIQFSVMAGGNQ